MSELLTVVTVLGMNFACIVAGGWLVRWRLPSTGDEWLVRLSGAAVVTYVALLVKYTL